MDSPAPVPTPLALVCAVRSRSSDRYAAEAARLLKLFDRYKPEKAVVIPPAFLDHAM
jgi:hypothetical protein